MKWIINSEEYTDARQAADYIMDNANESYYDDMLDECNDEICICGMTYAASIVLYRVDPIAYNCGRSDWEDTEASNIEYELERMNSGKTETFYDTEVECIED